MTNTKRIIFFGSGDFPRYAFSRLADMAWCCGDDCGFKVVGLVTSRDKCEDKRESLKEIAGEFEIPTKVVKDCNDEGLYEWCKSLNPDIFIVISFKKIPQGLLELVNGNAFNVHASILPLLRGANPIRWAIRYGMKCTGLTAIELSDKIDCGNILRNITIDIEDGETYGTLKEKLSELCEDFTYSVLKDYFINGKEKPIIKQCDYGIDFEPFKAPKVNKGYFSTNFEDLCVILRSVAPYDGIKCRLVVSKKTPSTKYLIGYHYKTYETYDCTLWGLHEAERGQMPTMPIWTCIGNTTMKDYIIDEIQIEGKKRMKFNEFKNGFKYLKDEKIDRGAYRLHIELY